MNLRVNTSCSLHHAANSSAGTVKFLREHGLKRGGLLPRLAAAAALGDPTTAVIFAALAVELTNTLDGGLFKPL